MSSARKSIAKSNTNDITSPLRVDSFDSISSSTLPELSLPSGEICEYTPPAMVLSKSAHNGWNSIENDISQV
jgi:hypothetical protein